LRPAARTAAYAAGALVALAVAGCGPRAGDVAGPPPIPRRSGPPEIDVVYPRAGSFIAARDSNFIFGSVGTGDARLQINGQAVPVEPNGAFLAWLPVPAHPGDTLAVYTLLATVGGARLETTHTVRVPVGPEPMPLDSAAIDAASIAPRGTWWATEGELVEVRVRATQGATVQLLTPDGDTLMLSEIDAGADPAEGAWAFGNPPLTPGSSGPGSGEYVGELVVRAPLGLGRLSPGLLPVPADVNEFARLCAPTPTEAEASEEDSTAMAEPVESADTTASADSAAVGAGAAAMPGDQEPTVEAAAQEAESPESEPCGVLETVLGSDTARARLPLDLWVLARPGPVVRLREATSDDLGSDGFVVGRAAPGGTTLWLWSEGVRARVTGRRNDVTRIALDGVTEAWLGSDELVWLPQTTLPGRRRVGTVRIAGLSDRLRVDVSLSDPAPYQVQMDGRDLALTLYGAYAATDWLRYGPADPFLQSARWEQLSADRYVLHLSHAVEPWGYRVTQRPGALTLEVRKPPRIDPDRPLAGRRIAVDPGHPPAGATGPTRLYEGDANLAVARRLQRMLEAEGAEVVMTRTNREPVRLYDRTRTAEAAGAELLVSVHNNALPDGVNPFEGHGTSVYYFHPFSRPLAAELQRHLLLTMGLADLGIGRASLALVRPTWLPSALTEGAFMMIPAQEAGLRDPRFQEAYARGLLEGIRAFLRERAW